MFTTRFVPPFSGASFGREALFLLLVIASRLPFLLTGYGSDADAWGVASVAKRLWHTGEYGVSRFPGYPLHEMVSAPCVALGGAALSNAATLLASVAGLAVLFRIAARHAYHAEMLVITLAFTPLFWINSATTLDYCWSLLFLSLSLHGALKKQTIIAGVGLGIAAGFRLPNLVAAVPLLVLLYHKGITPKSIFVFIASSTAVTLVAYSPPLIAYGPAGWIQLTREEMSDIHITWTDRSSFFLYRTVYAIGPLAVVAGLAILLTNRRELKAQLTSHSPLMISSIVGVGVFVALFFCFPLERAYLLPAVLFLLIIIASLSTRLQLIAFAACTASFAFVNPDVVIHQGMVGTLGPNIHWGMVVAEIQKRQDLLANRVRIATIPITGKSMVMTGGGPAFWFENEYVEPDTSSQWRELNEQVVRKKSDPGTCFIALLQPAEVARVRSMGYTVYCLKSARAIIERTTGVPIEADHVVLVDW